MSLVILVHTRVALHRFFFPSLHGRMHQASCMHARVSYRSAAGGGGAALPSEFGSRHARAALVARAVVPVACGCARACKPATGAFVDPFWKRERSRVPDAIYDERRHSVPLPFRVTRYLRAFMQCIYST